ncbi:MAG: 7-carboxy-7-deazaguanine synthase QueE [Bacteroidota bacterium]|nr:7-carboxy-7-deazaguanine synthase QueE [Bacteroidota bacterium]
MNNEMNTSVALPVMEHFYTIQGEGAYSGTAAYFVRIGGCDVGCHWCDVKESWEADKHPTMRIEEIVAQIKQTNTHVVVITGGEPLMWDMESLTKALKNERFRIHIETSGAYKFTGHWDWVCLSPKKTKLPVEEAYHLAQELKIIIYNQHDFVFAEEQAKRVNPTCRLYLQPEWSKKDSITEDIIAYVKKRPKWQISLQTHKYLNIP